MVLSSPERSNRARIKGIRIDSMQGNPASALFISVYPFVKPMKSRQSLTLEILSEKPNRNSDLGILRQLTAWWRWDEYSSSMGFERNVRAAIRVQSTNLLKALNCLPRHS